MTPNATTLPRSIDEIIANAKTRERKTIVLALIWLFAALALGLTLSAVILKFRESQRQIDELQQKLTLMTKALETRLEQAGQQLDKEKADLIQLTTNSTNMASTLNLEKNEIQLEKSDLKDVQSKTEADGQAAEKANTSVMKAQDELNSLKTIIAATTLAADGLSKKAQEQQKMIEASNQQAREISSKLASYKQDADQSSATFNERITYLEKYNAIGNRLRNGPQLLSSAEFKIATNDYAGAIADFTSVIELVPKSARAYNGRGQANAALGQYAEAVQDFDSAIELDPKNPDYVDNRGLANNRLKKYAAAIADFSIANKLAPDSPFPLSNRAVAETFSGAHEAAIADINSAINMDATNASYYNTRGFVYYTLGNDAVAEANFRKAADLLKLRAYKVQVLDNIGLIYLRSGQWKKAYDYAVNLSTISDASIWNELVLGIAAARLGKIDVSNRALSKWQSARSPDDIEELDFYLPEQFHPYIDGPIAR